MIDDLYGRCGAKMITCDCCGDGFEAESWDAARQRMKEDGWKIKRIDHEYKHFCTDCAACAEEKHDKVDGRRIRDVRPLQAEQKTRISTDNADCDQPTKLRIERTKDGYLVKGIDLSQIP